MTAPDGAVPDADAEVALTGGYSSVVVRSGDTVRRSGAPWTPTVQSLLAHLHASGIAEVPAPLGVEPYASFLARGHVDEIEGDRAWLREHTDRLLSGPAS